MEREKREGNQREREEDRKDGKIFPQGGAFD